MSLERTRVGSCSLVQLIILLPSGLSGRFRRSRSWAELVGPELELSLHCSRHSPWSSFGALHSAAGKRPAVMRMKYNDRKPRGSQIGAASPVGPTAPSIVGGKNYPKLTAVRRRLRIVPPIAPKPASIIAQLAGSGTPPDGGPEAESTLSKSNAQCPSRLSPATSKKPPLKFGLSS